MWLLLSGQGRTKRGARRPGFCARVCDGMAVAFRKSFLSARSLSSSVPLHFRGWIVLSSHRKPVVRKEVRFEPLATLLHQYKLCASSSQSYLLCPRVFVPGLFESVFV